MNKHLVSIAILAGLSAPVMASPFYVDAGTDFDGSGSSIVGLINQLEVAYKSTSFVTDDNNDGVLSAGDKVVSTGGFLQQDAFGANKYATQLEAIGDTNLVTSFDPNYFGNNNGYNSSYVLTFGFDNLMGEYDGSFFNYTSGTVVFDLYDTVNGVTAGVLEVEISDTDNDIANTVFNGSVVAGSGVFGTAFGETFADYLASGGNIAFRLDQNTNDASSGSELESLINQGFAANAPYVPIDGGDHGGQVSFDVPEPTSVALLGLGLLGLAGSRRRKQ